MTNKDKNNVQSQGTQGMENTAPQRMVKYTMEIDGKSYRLKSDGSIDELKAIGQVVNDKINKLKAGEVYIDKTKLYLSTALGLAEDYVRLWQHYNYLQMQNENLIKKLEEKSAE